MSRSTPATKIIRRYLKTRPLHARQARDVTVGGAIYEVYLHATKGYRIVRRGV